MTRGSLLLNKLQAARTELEDTSIIGVNATKVNRAINLITDAIDVLLLHETPEEAAQFNAEMLKEVSL